MTGEPGGGWSLQRRTPWRLVATAFVALAACDGAGPGDARSGPAEAASIDGGTRRTQLVDTDVEAPEVFQVTAQGLWDGRPSLGGVWVAHPDVAEPERVVIRNQDNGQFVIGALFRRERDNPGPALQVSSDAAEALAMLAGAPATLDVTALRREEAAEPAPTEASDPTNAPAQATLDAESGDAGPPPADPATTDPATTDPAAGAVARATAAILEGAPAPSAQPSAAPDPEAPDSEAPDPEAFNLERPFIQLGTFSLEANAQALAEDLAAKGLPARAVASTIQGADVFRVLVGPAATEAERAALRDRVAAEGFGDAILVTS
jgi:cell division protein FtsN